MDITSTSKIKSSMQHATSKGYSLFSEALDSSNYKKIKEQPFINEYYNDIRTYADKVCNNKLPDLNFQLFNRFSVDGNRLSYEKEYFERWKMLFALAAVTITDQSDKYIPQIENYLWNFCDQYSWALPAHLPTNLEEMKKSSWPSEEIVDLFSSETAFSLAEIVYLLKGRLNPTVTYRVEKEIERRVLKPFMDDKMFWWETASMNWASVCAGSVGCAAIYMVQDEDRLTLILQRVLGALSSYLEGFGADGATTEGLGYWRYGFGYYVFFAQLLKERTLGEIDLFYTNLKNSKIRKIAAFPGSLQLSKGAIVNFSDSMEKFYPNAGLFRILEKTYGNLGYDYSRCSLYAENETNKWTYLIRDLFWGLSAQESDKEVQNEGQSYFPNAQWFIKKQTNQEEGLIAMAAKGGSNGEPHNHNDLGHFIIHYKGYNLLSDIGCPEYVKEFFRDETRYSFFNASSLSHSVPVISGKLQSPGASAYAEVIEIQEQADSSRFLLDLTRAYDVEALQKYTREFIWNNKAVNSEKQQAILHIRDEFYFEKAENKVLEAFITRYKPELIKDGQIKIAQDAAALFLEYDSSKCSADIEEHEYSDHYGVKRKAYRIVLELSEKGSNLVFDIDFKLL